MFNVPAKLTCTSLQWNCTQAGPAAPVERSYVGSFQATSCFLSSMAWFSSQLRPSHICSRTSFSAMGAGVGSTARIERPPSHRGGSASTETSQLPRFSPTSLLVLSPRRVAVRLVSYCARPTRAFRGRALREHRRPTGYSCGRFHLMLQPTLARCLLSTGFPASTASIAARRSRPVTGLLLPGRLSSSCPR